MLKVIENLSSDLQTPCKTLLHWCISVTLSLQWSVCVKRQVDLSKAPWPASLVKNEWQASVLV